MRRHAHALVPSLALWMVAGCSPAPTPVPDLEPAPVATATPEAGQSVADAIRARHEMFRGFIEDATRRMPADRYDFRPVPEIMSYGDLINHIAAVQYGFCAVAMSDREAEALDLSRTDKASATELLARSFAYCEQAYGDLTDANASDLVGIGQRDPTARIRPLLANISHNSLEYGKLTIHLRLNGIVPPSSAAADLP